MTTNRVQGVRLEEAEGNLVALLERANRSGGLRQRPAHITCEQRRCLFVTWKRRTRTALTVADAQRCALPTGET